MEMPLVSIILPVYNAQSHLNRCLGSICAQQYEDLEIIVINDGSKDQSLPVCEEFRKKDSRILLVDKANSGVSEHLSLRPLQKGHRRGQSLLERAQGRAGAKVLTRNKNGSAPAGLPLFCSLCPDGGALLGQPVALILGCLLYTSPSPRDRG